MKKKNLLVLAIAIGLIAAIMVLSMLLPQSRSISPNASSVSSTEVPANEQKSEATNTDDPQAGSSETVTQQVEAYLVVSVCGNLYEPLPLAGEGVFTIKQDENISNTVHVTPTSVWMEHSTCDNQDCVDQGTVSLENMKSRVLSNMIICLPNEVVLELHTPESLATNFGWMEE